MTLKSEIWQKLGENTVLRLKVALALGITERGLIRSIKARSENLTKKAATKVIAEELQIDEESLFEENEHAAA